MDKTEPADDLPTRELGWDGMWVSPEDDPRGDDGGTDERSVLTGYLRNYRLTLRLKCAGLDAEQLARRSVPPSTLSLLGLVRHLAYVEQHWFRIRLSGQPVPYHYRDQGPDGEFDGAVGDPAVVDDAFATWQSEIAFAEAYVDAAPDLDQVGARGRAARHRRTHDRGVRPALRARRPAARADRRPRRPVTWCEPNHQPTIGFVLLPRMTV